MNARLRLFVNLSSTVGLCSLLRQELTWNLLFLQCTLTYKVDSTAHRKWFWATSTAWQLTCGVLVAFWLSFTQGIPSFLARMKSSNLPASWRLQLFLITAQRLLFSNIICMNAVTPPLWYLACKFFLYSLCSIYVLTDADLNLRGILWWGPSV